MNKISILEIINKAPRFIDPLLDKILTEKDRMAIFKKDEEYTSDTLMQAYGVIKAVQQCPERFVDNYDVNIDYCDMTNHLYVDVDFRKEQTIVQKISSDYLVQLHRRPQTSLHSSADFEILLKDYFFVRQTLLDEIKYDDDKDENAAILTPKVLREYAKIFSKARSITIFERDYETKVVSVLPETEELEKWLFKTISKTVELVNGYDDFHFHKPLDFKNMFNFYETHQFTPEDYHYLTGHELHISFDSYIKEFEIQRKSIFKYNKEIGGYELFHKDSRSLMNIGELKEDKVFRSHQELNDFMESIKGYNVRNLDLE